LQGYTQTAKWWHSIANESVVCTLCPRNCTISIDSHGFCSTRSNRAGKLVTSSYNCASGVAVDPVEKKPLYHFLPGSTVFSFGTIGCNLSCEFCQNWSLSQPGKRIPAQQKTTPQQLVETAINSGCSAIAYTYNEPTIFGEWVITVSQLAREHGLKNVMVTNGYISSDARSAVYQYIDAVNIDLKAFSREFYRKLTHSQLDPVLETLSWIANQPDIWLEITNLLIPDENDSEHDIFQLTKYIAEELGKEIPLHFSAFHPAHKMLQYQSTSRSILENAKTIASGNGIKYTYLVNIFSDSGQNTVCPRCKEELILRKSYSTKKKMIQNGHCINCNESIPGVF